MSTQVMTHAPAAPSISPLRVFVWSVRREIWENRSIYLVPLAVGVLIVLATTINVMHVAPALHTATLDPAMQQKDKGAETPFVFASLLLMFSTMVVSVFYAVDALYGERRDRSVLFWKSMPVSDTTTVLAKLTIPLLVLPLVTFVVTFLVQLIMLLIGSMTSAGVAHLWLPRLWWNELFHLVALHGFWWAPFWGWFLLASAWSRRAPLLTAVLPPLVIGFAEEIAFGTARFGHWLMFRFVGGMDGSTPQANAMSSSSLMPMTPLEFLGNVHLWTGFAICAVFLAAAIYLRRQRGPA